MSNGEEAAIQSLEISRAEAASTFIDGLKSDDSLSDKDRQEVRTEIESLPGKIINNGLLQTLVYLLESDKSDRKKVGAELLRYLQERFASSGQTGASPKAAIALCRQNRFEVSDEARQYVHWLKMMAKAEIPKKAEDEKAKIPERSDAAADS